MSHASYRHGPDPPVDLLLVEDHPGDARLLEEALAETACDTTLHVVESGDDALAYLRQEGEYASASRPDLVFLDLELPGRDGFAVLDALGEEEELARLPVIVLTGSNETEDVARSYGAHANAYLTKPRDHAGFVVVVKTVERFWFEQVTLPPQEA